jgi:hypothetical protein
MPQNERDDKKAKRLESEHLRQFVCATGNDQKRK